MSLAWRAPLLALVLVSVAGTASAQAQQPDTTSARGAGFYTAEQGTRGAEVYRGQCERCHTLADHTGADFKLAWHGRTVRSLFDYLRGTMPDDDPGTLTEQQYLDVTAYLLKVNGMPAGVAPLAADTAALAKLVIDIKSASGLDERSRLRRLFR